LTSHQDFKNACLSIIEFVTFSFSDEDRETIKNLKVGEKVLSKSKKNNLKLSSKKGKEKNGDNYFNMLSEEIQILVLNSIRGPLILYCCTLVCKNWRRLIIDNRLGYHTAIKEIKIATFGDPFTTNFNMSNPYHKEINLNNSQQIRKRSPNDKKKKKPTKKSYSNLKEELKEFHRLYMQERKNHKQNNILYNEQIERLETQIMDYRKQNNQLLIQLSQLSNEVICLRKINFSSENKIKALENLQRLPEKFNLDENEDVDIDGGNDNDEMMSDEYIDEDSQDDNFFKNAL